MTDTFRPAENLQDAVNLYREEAKSWHDQSAKYRCVFAEDYCRGAISIVYELKISAWGRPENDGLRKERSGLGRESLALLIFHCKASQLVYLNLWNQKPMLVGDVELVKMVEGFSPASYVRLYFIDEPFRDGTEDDFLFWSALDKCFKSRSGWVYREVGPTFVFAGQITASDNIPPYVIESAAEVVYGISHNQSEPIWEGLNRDDLNKLIARFRISLDGDSASTFIAAEETSSLAVEVLDVLIGPLNLLAGTVEPKNGHCIVENPGMKKIIQSCGQGSIPEGEKLTLDYSPLWEHTNFMSSFVAKLKDDVENLRKELAIREAALKAALQVQGIEPSRATKDNAPKRALVNASPTSFILSTIAENPRIRAGDILEQARAVGFKPQLNFPYKQLSRLKKIGKIGVEGGKYYLKEKASE